MAFDRQASMIPTGKPSLPRLKTIRSKIALIVALMVAAVVLLTGEETRHFLRQGLGQMQQAGDGRMRMYSRTRGDGSGAMIQDMLMAHAYAFRQNWTYAGACGLEVENIKKEMVKALGLKKAMPILVECPENGPDDQVVSANDYRPFDSELWTPEWLEWVQTIAGSSTPPAKRKVVVHIRRGDVSVCNEKLRFRYLTNQYYLRLLSNYSADEVTIFSENNGEEGWDDFKQYHLELGTRITDAWKAMKEAEVLILSKSSFSYVPALLNRGTVIYYPFWHAPAPGWHVVDEAMQKEQDDDITRVVQQYCA